MVDIHSQAMAQAVVVVLAQRSAAFSGQAYWNHSRRSVGFRKPPHGTVALEELRMRGVDGYYLRSRCSE